jgi:SEC-C motif-containing protein
MSTHSDLLATYKRLREVRLRLNSLLVETIPKSTLEDCARKLGLFRRGTLVFDSEDEMALLMDYCLYYPDRDGRNLVMKYLENSPPSADSEEMIALRAMTRAYYSLIQVTDVERGVGVAVHDLLRDETGFLMDVGFGNSAQRHWMLASRIVPSEGFLATSGAALPVDPAAATRIVSELKKRKQTPETFDFKRITPMQEAELAALMIRTCLSFGMSSRIAYAEPGAHIASPTKRALASSPGTIAEAPRPGRNDPCPCGSGKKYKLCCGRR